MWGVHYLPFEALHYLLSFLPFLLVVPHDRLKDLLPSDLAYVHFEGHVFIVLVPQISLAEFYINWVSTLEEVEHGGILFAAGGLSPFDFEHDG